MDFLAGLVRVDSFIYVCRGVEMTSAKECIPPDIFSQVVLCEVGNDAA